MASVRVPATKTISTARGIFLRLFELALYGISGPLGCVKELAIRAVMRVLLIHEYVTDWVSKIVSRLLDSFERTNRQSPVGGGPIVVGTSRSIGRHKSTQSCWSPSPKAVARFFSTE
jgi:hypothetical protein